MVGNNKTTTMTRCRPVGIIPTRTPRTMVNRGLRLCGDMYPGVRSVVVQQVYGGAAMRLDQAQAIVAAAGNHLCNFAVTGFTPNPVG